MWNPRETPEERAVRVAREYANAMITYDRASRLDHRPRTRYHAKLVRKGKDEKRRRRLRANGHVAHDLLRASYVAAKGEPKRITVDDL